MDNFSEAAYRSRLDAWRDELETNKYGQRHNAERVIAVLESDIERRWPEKNKAEKEG